MSSIRAKIAIKALEWATSLPSARSPWPTETEILQAVDEYAATGMIPELLWRYFDQHGNWYGAGNHWRRKTRAKAKATMKDAKLPMIRTVSRHRCGKLVLNTSFVIKMKQPVAIPYHEIMGSVFVAKVECLHAPKLRCISGSFVCSSHNEIEVPDLIQVDGDFRVPYSRKLKAPLLAHVGRVVVILESNLPRLETVGSWMTVRFSDQCEAPRLVYVGEEINSPIARRMELPRLQFVGGTLNVSLICERIDAPQLKVIGANFPASDAKTINAPKLEMVGLDMSTRACRRFFLSALEVGGCWKMHPEARNIRVLEDAAREALHEEPGFEL